MSLKSTGEVLKRADLARVPVDGLNVIHAAGATKLVRRKTIWLLNARRPPTPEASGSGRMRGSLPSRVNWRMRDGPPRRSVTKREDSVRVTPSMTASLSGTMTTASVSVPAVGKRRILPRGASLTERR